MDIKRKSHIRDRRKALGLSQAALAEIIGTSQRQVSKYETGQSDISGDVLNLLADALDTTVDYLLERTDYPERPLRGEYDLNEIEREAIEILRSKPITERQKVIDILKVL